MKVLGQVFVVHPLVVVVSLPNQLFGHVPITNISSQLTGRLEALDEDDAHRSRASLLDEVEDSDEEGDDRAPLPELSDIFRPGQYVRACIVAVHSFGATSTGSGLGGRPKDEIEKASRRVELSLVPKQVNDDIVKADIKPGLVRLFNGDG
jgi:rRNA biogenesis protein RRP5